MIQIRVRQRTDVSIGLWWLVALVLGVLLLKSRGRQRAASSVTLPPTAEPLPGAEP